VALVCKEKEIPYEFIAVSLPKGEHKDPSFVEKQPFGQVPYIVSQLVVSMSSTPSPSIEG